MAGGTEVMELVDCASFLLLDGGRFLVEQRKVDRVVDPGAIAIPGGHLEPGESPRDALYREVREELGVAVDQAHYLCTLLHRSSELRKLHYFAVLSWSGEIENNEAEALHWLTFGQTDRLDLAADRVAFAEYLRIFKP